MSKSLSAYARQFLEMMQKPDVDQIDGLSPAISIEQKTTSRNPRSTVGTVTEIYDYMRLLWARVGIPYSPATGLPIESQTVSQMVDRVLDLPEKTRLYLLAPVVRGRKGEYRKEIAEFQKKGFQRLKIDGEYLRHRRGPGPRQEIQARHRRGGGPHRRARRHRGAAGGIRSRPRSTSPTASPSSNMPTRRTRRATAETHRLLVQIRLPGFGLHDPEIEPRLFSFNNPFGACPTCGGIGHEMRIDEALIVPDETHLAEARRDRALGEITRPITRRRWRRSPGITSSSMTKPWAELPETGARGDPLRLGRHQDPHGL